MIKVRILRGVQRGVQVGLTGATGLAALTSNLGACAAPAEGDDAATSNETALTVQDPGSGVFELAWTYGTPTGYSFALGQSSTDEYVRAGEKMTFAIPAYFMWARLHPNDAVPTDVTRLEKLSATVNAVFMKNGAAYASKAVATTGWRGTQPYELAATTAQLTIAAKADAVRFELTLADADDPSAHAALGQSDFLEVPVFGGAIPNKTALFDTMGSQMRTRIVEGGNPVAGASLAIGYTDWRAATLVDASSVDRQIGTATTYGRFGAFDMPIYGDLVYEVAMAYAVDGQWQSESALTADATSRLMPPFGRTAYEGAIAVPSGAQKLEAYFHVKAFVVADYSKFQNVTWKKYGDGARVLVREKWDNEHGAAFDNWDLVTESP